MSKLVVIEHLTLDGVLQSPARPDEDTRDGFEYGGWSVPGGDQKMMEVQGARMGNSWSLLVGRITYDDFSEYWRKQPDNPITQSLNNAQKFVTSNTLSEPLSWANSTLLTGDAGDAVAKLKVDHDKTLVVFGSGALVQSLMRRSLIDEYVLMIHPLVLGTGHRLFAESSPYATLSLTDSVSTDTGVIIATYQPTAQS